MVDVYSPAAEEAERQEFYDGLRMILDDRKENLSLSEADLKDKRILEIGAANRSVAAAVMLAGLTKEFYSLEPALKHQTGYAESLTLEGILDKLPADLRAEIEKRTVTTTAEKTGFKDDEFDLVIGTGVNFDSPRQLQNRLEELLRVGKDVRLYPYDKTTAPAYDKAVAAISKKMDLDVARQVTTDELVNTGGKKPRHVLESVLVLKRR